MRVKVWEKLECDLFVTNSIKQDKALTSNGSFNLSKLEGTQGLVTEGKCHRNLSCLTVLTGLKARCQRNRQSPFYPTKHSHAHTTTLGDLMVAQ